MAVSKPTVQLLYIIVSVGDLWFLLIWCGWWDLNPYAFRQQILSLPRLPFRHTRMLAGLWYLPCNFTSCVFFVFISHKYFIKTKLRFEQQPPTVRLLTCSFSSVNRFFLSQKEINARKGESSWNFYVLLFWLNGAPDRTWTCTPFWHENLNLTRMPISPQTHIKMLYCETLKQWFLRSMAGIEPASATFAYDGIALAFPVGCFQLH